MAKEEDETDNAAEEELEAIAAIYAQELVYIKRDTDIPRFSARAAGPRQYARLVLFRFDSAVTEGCAHHKGVYVAIGMPADYPAAGLDVAAALDSETAAGLCGDEGDQGDGETPHGCGCHERLIRLAPFLREDVRAKGGIWLSDCLPPASSGSDHGSTLSLSRHTDGVDDSPLGACPR
jgi:hypothetical protein